MNQNTCRDYLYPQTDAVHTEQELLSLHNTTAAMYYYANMQ